MPPRLGHLAASERAALILRFHVAAVFRDGGLPGADPRCHDVQAEHVVGPLLTHANRLRLAREDEIEPRLLRALDELAGVDLAGDGPARAVIRARAAAIAERVKTLIADAGYRSDVPAVLTELFDGLSDLVWERYRTACPWYGPRPLTYLDMGRTHEHNTTDLLAETALLASCRVDDAERPTSIVRLGVRDNGFVWDTSCQLAYVLVHELLCHAFQGLGEPPCAARGTPPPAREMTDPSCAWSEGWMDAVALWTTERWIDAGVGIPDWARQDVHALRTRSCVLHDRRGDPQASLPPDKLDRRRAARTAAGAMREECRAFGTEGEDRMETFSLCLNALPMAQDERDDLVDLIGLGFELTVDDDRDAMIGALMKLPRDGDWRALGAFLKGILDAP